MILSFRYYNPQEPQLLSDFPNCVLTVSPKAISGTKQSAIYLYNFTKKRREVTHDHVMHKNDANYFAYFWHKNIKYNLQ